MKNEALNDFIYGKDKRLQLLEYGYKDINEVSRVLGEITLDLMDQCYKHTVNFHEYNKQKNKRYHKIQNIVTEQLKDLLFIQKEFVNKFLKPGKKTKEDLYEYVYAYQMFDLFYDQYIYRVLVEALKREFSDEFWTKYNLDDHLLEKFNIDRYFLRIDTKDEVSTGQVNYNFDEAIAIIDKYAKNSKIENKLDAKLELIKKIGNVLGNYPCHKINMLHMPYGEAVEILVNHIKVSLDMEKSKLYQKKLK